MRIATWNVNSIRTRLDRVEAWLARREVDVLMVQELKAREEQIPLMGLQALGYETAVVGHNQWNGVAVFSRVGLEQQVEGFDAMPHFGEPPAAEARAVSAVAGGIRVASLYVPNGRKLDDPHYAYKLEWLRALRAATASWLDEPAVLAGDWNIAPRDEDVFDMGQFRGKTHVSPAERAEFQAFLDAGWVDTSRPHTEGPDVYTYFDYYRQRFERNRGLRIDFLLGSPAVAERVTGAFIDTDERDPAQGEGTPSDHCPVVVDLAD